MPHPNHGCPTPAELIASANGVLDGSHPFTILERTDSEVVEFVWPDWEIVTEALRGNYFKATETDRRRPGIILMRNRYAHDWFILIYNHGRSLFPMRHSTMAQWWRFGKGDMQAKIVSGTTDDIFHGVQKERHTPELMRWVCAQFPDEERTAAELAVLALAE